jgi:hypothetical protein
MRAPRGDQLRLYQCLRGKVVQERDVTVSRCVTVDSGRSGLIATLIHGMLFCATAHPSRSFAATLSNGIHRRRRL